GGGRRGDPQTDEPGARSLLLRQSSSPSGDRDGRPAGERGRFRRRSHDRPAAGRGRRVPAADALGRARHRLSRLPDVDCRAHEGGGEPLQRIPLRRLQAGDHRRPRGPPGRPAGDGRAGAQGRRPASDRRRVRDRDAGGGALRLAAGGRRHRRLGPRRGGRESAERPRPSGRGSGTLARSSLPPEFRSLIRASFTRASVGEGQYLKVLNRPDLPAEALAWLLADRTTRKYHAVRRALAGHPKTPRREALALVATLYWRDLAFLSADARVHPEVRRAADRDLARRLPEMALAERVDVAKSAGRGTLLLL